MIASLALTPLAIAIHRFILLGETTSSYRLELGQRRFRRFAFYTFLLNLIALAPGFCGFYCLPSSSRYLKRPWYCSDSVPPSGPSPAAS